MFFIYMEELFGIINNIRAGFFMEEYGEYKSISSSINYQYFEIKPTLKSIIIIFKSFTNFIITPFLKGKFTMFSLILLFEVLIIYFYLYLRIKNNPKIYFLTLFKWTAILLLSYLFYSLFIFNDGTILRYKVPIFFFVIFGYFANVKQLNSK